MREFDNLKETILKDAPRFREKDKFKFSCHKGLSCFTQCCADVNIFLTPYDIIRMKNRLKMSSEEFLAKYTFVPFNEKQQLPIVVLKMRDDEQKRCQFVTADGCGIYEDRPWSCRMYPLGFASPAETTASTGAGGPESFYFLMEEKGCCGFAENREQSVGEWLENQGIAEYNSMGESFKELTLHPYFQKGGQLDPERMEMLYMACYNLDKFRRFIFESRFLQYFDVDADIVESIRNDDIALMKFAFRWLRFALFREPTMKVRDEVLQTRKQMLTGKEKAL
ncbi:MAG: YkgJ family cysteine cluster protein [Candidatus Abyssobacteria bacterium SURF_17]|jgi:Fe-S-cluster containining protein|uniref:YkgJ family cysteine cluster protein n=1 Tax=Candidatus Abyssobacteria bacterium SURF_17 TaxID=2093361 RepID=A0A419EYC5_9BACT|nr:MAG: YkgJ family cysteine cluster protein [Candidatus Abyssubacteria bacterium SURF_17]